MMTDLDFDNLSQGELAKLIEVDRATIHAWGREGMPYKKPSRKGEKGAYSLSACIHWRAGHDLSRRRGLRDIELTPLQKVALGWILGNGTTNFRDDDIAAFSNMLEGIGIERETALRDLDFARGVVDATC